MGNSRHILHYFFLLGCGGNGEVNNADKENYVIPHKSNEKLNLLANIPTMEAPEISQGDNLIEVPKFDINTPPELPREELAEIHPITTLDIASNYPTFSSEVPQKIEDKDKNNVVTKGGKRPITPKIAEKIQIQEAHNKQMKAAPKSQMGKKKGSSTLVRDNIPPLDPAVNELSAKIGGKFEEIKRIIAEDKKNRSSIVEESNMKVSHVLAKLKSAGKIEVTGEKKDLYRELSAAFGEQARVASEDLTTIKREELKGDFASISEFCEKISSSTGDLAPEQLDSYQEKLKKAPIGGAAKATLMELWDRGNYDLVKLGVDEIVKGVMAGNGLAETEGVQLQRTGQVAIENFFQKWYEKCNDCANWDDFYVRSLEVINVCVEYSEALDSRVKKPCMLVFSHTYDILKKAEAAYRDATKTTIDVARFFVIDLNNIKVSASSEFENKIFSAFVPASAKVRKVGAPSVLLTFTGQVLNKLYYAILKLNTDDISNIKGNKKNN